MAKILSFEVTDELYARIVAQQQKENITYLSPFLRELIEDALAKLETKEDDSLSDHQ